MMIRLLSFITFVPPTREQPHAEHRNLILIRQPIEGAIDLTGTRISS